MADSFRNKRFFYINSANRISGTSSSFCVPIQIPVNEEYDSMCVTQVSIPISYYLVPAGMNTMQLVENGTHVTITIPSGNYNINSFCLIVQALLTSHSPNSLTYTMTYPSSFTQNNSGLITYTVSSTTVTCSFIFDPENYLNEQFGFASGSTVTFQTGTLVSANVVNYVNENTIFIHSDIVSNGADDILQEVYGTNNTVLSIMTWVPPQVKAYSKRLMAPQNQLMNVYITDENKRPINLNGQEMQFSLLVYKSDSINDSVQKFIDLCKTFMQYITEQLNQAY
jgi:hypothetical protein